MRLFPRLFACDGDCATVRALREELDHLRGLVDRLMLTQSPSSAVALLQHEQLQRQRPVVPEKKLEKSEYRSPFGNRTISHHPKSLALLRELEESRPKVRR